MKKSKIDKMLRLAEIKKPINESFVNKWVEVIKESSDGNTYCIVEENKKYYIMFSETKKTIKESDLSYLGGLKNKRKNGYKTYRESINALSYLLHENNRNNLLNEVVNVYESDYKLVEGEYVNLNEKKFVLKQSKPKKQPKDDFNFDMDSEDSSEEDDFNFDMDSEDSSEEDDFNFDMDSEDSSEEDDFNFDMDSEDSESDDFDFDMDSEDSEADDLDFDDDMDSEDSEADDLDFDDDMDSDYGGDNIKKIQSTTGKLGQQLRDTEDLSSDTQKWVIKSVISALNLDKIDPSDKEDIVNSIENSGEEAEFMEDVNYMEDEDLNGELLLDNENINDEQSWIKRIMKLSGEETTNEGMSHFLKDDTNGGMGWVSEGDSKYIDEDFVESLPKYNDTEEAPVKTPVETPSKPKRRQPFRPNRETNPNPKAFKDRDLDFDSLLNGGDDVTFE